MKHSFAIATLLASGLALSSAAQTAPAAAAPASTAPAGPAKIAVIAFQAAVAQTNEGQRNFADLQKKYQPKESVLKTQSDEIEGLTKQLQAQGATLSEAAKASQARTIDEKKKKLDRDAEDLRNEGQQEMQEMMGTLASKVYDVLSSYAQQQGYTLVLVEAYNTKSGVPAPPAQPAAAARPAAPKPPASH
jgi:outer membrane protein